MEYFVKSIVPVIETKYDKFTNVEKRIADFFIGNREKKNLSAKEVSERLYVSEASLSRFAKKCGYRGYREFIYQYEESFLERPESVADNTQMVLNAYQELLNKTYNILDEVQIERIVEYLGQAERVFVCGKGSSGFAASEIALRFMRIGVDIQVVNDMDQMRMRAVFQDERSLILGISISGEAEEVLYLLEESHARGSRTVLFTAQNRKQFQRYCDEVALFPSLKNLNYGNAISPQFPVLVIADILYSCYAKQDRQKKERFHEDTLHALKGRGRHDYSERKTIR